MGHFSKVGLKRSHGSGCSNFWLARHRRFDAKELLRKRDLRCDLENYAVTVRTAAERRTIQCALITLLVAANTPSAIDRVLEGSPENICDGRRC